MEPETSTQASAEEKGEKSKEDREARAAAEKEEKTLTSRMHWYCQGCQIQ